MAWLALLFPICWVLLLTSLRYGGVVPAYHRAPGGAMVWAAAVLLTLAAAWALARRAAEAGTARALLEICVVVAAGALFVWGLLPAGPPPPLPLTLGILLLLGLSAWIWRDRSHFQDWGLGWAGFVPALRLLLLPTLLALVGALIAGMSAGQEIQPARVLFSLVGYPFYAFVQLFFFVLFLAPRLRELSSSNWTVILVTAGLFALAHWPNAVIAWGCFGAMCFWMWVYQRVPNLPALALSMGCAATAFTQFLPEAWTHHSRVGPGYVLHRHLGHEFGQDQRAIERVGSDAFFAASGSSLPGFVDAMFAELLARSASPQESAHWQAQAALVRRETVVRDFHVGPERVERFGPLPSGKRSEHVPRDLTAALPEELPEDLEGRVDYFSSTAWFQQQGGSFRGFLRGLYRDVLGRPPSEAELVGWSQRLDAVERGKVVQRLLRSPEFEVSAPAQARASRHLAPLWKL